MIIRNIWCVGRNYADHAKELGHAPPQRPLIFLKAGTCSLNSGFPLSLPNYSNEIHHEVELAFQFGDELAFTKCCIALDLTLRDIQTQLKKDQSPWTLAKSFKNSAPLGNFFSLEDLTVPLEDLEIRLFVNQELRQLGKISNMIFDISTLREFMLDHFPVTSGDLLLTGTPAGVAALKSGDKLLAEAFHKSQDQEQVLSQGEWQVCND